ncbi:uncharacterized protein LOC143460850 [Clavelina lepadiformis]|uniref:Uncharacterized protein n=1 Tax=Clavelina lepadiformis TaxID=159417 RepID=A0ABP0GCP3_CLALP
MSFGADNDGLLQLLAGLQRLAQTDDDDDNKSDQESGATSDQRETSSEQSTSVERLLGLEAKATEYMEEGKHEEAYGLLKKQYKLGASVYFVRVLIKYFTTLITTDRDNKCQQIISELKSKIRDELEIPPDDLIRYAKQLQVKKEYFSAFLFFQLGASLLKNEIDIANVVNGMQTCALGCKLIVMALVNQNLASRALIKRQFIPQMLEMRRHLKVVHGVDKKQLCLVEANCLHHIEIFQGLVGDHNASEASINEAVNLMRETLGSDAEKFEIFSTHLNNLGGAYLRKNRPQDAARILSQAIAAMRKADFSTEAERISDIAKAENMLQRARSEF